FFFYTPTGTPFMDQHAFFFTLLMFLTAVSGTTAPTARSSFVWWFLTPMAFVLAYLSCQIPTAFGAVCIALWVMSHPRRAAPWIAAILAGTAVVAACGILLHWRLAFSWSDAFTYVVDIPLRQGSTRTPTPGVVAPVRMVLGTLRRLPSWARLWS